MAGDVSDRDLPTRAELALAFLPAMCTLALSVRMYSDGSLPGR
jgi:hypothetical protein